MFSYRILLGVLTWLAISSLGVFAKDELNHLEPVPAYDHSRTDYEQTVFKALIDDNWPDAWMIVRPSFRPEYAVVLRKVSEESGDSVRYELEYAEADQQIWNWREAGDGTQVIDLRKDVAVTRQTASLPTGCAERLMETWHGVLLQTTYAAKDWVGLDGIMYEFYVRPDIFGQTWSPKSGMPRMMVDCGELLIAYVAGDDESREITLRMIVDLLTKLRDEID